MTANVQAIRILQGKEQLGSAPFGEYDKPTKSLQLPHIEWGAQQPNTLLNTTLSLQGSFIADGGAFMNDMTLIGLHQAGMDGIFKA
jgi:hypothetical protein